MPDISRVMADSRTRFEAIWDTHFEAVLGYARRRAERADADEATSQTFLIAWRRLDDIPPGAELPWLLGTCRRVLANTRRSERRGIALRRRIETEPSASVSDPGNDVPERMAMVAAFRSLNATDRETLALIAWDGLTPTEAATTVGCSPARFRARLFRARRRLDSAFALADHTAASRPVPPDAHTTEPVKEDTR